MNVVIALLGFVAALIVGFLLREFGRAIVASALGYKIVPLSIEDGASALGSVIGPAWLVIGRGVIGGAVTAIPPVPNRAVASMMFIAAGPLVDIAWLFAVIDIARTFGQTGHVDAAMLGAISSQLFLTFFNLVPKTGSAGGRRWPNDGLLLWNILSGKEARNDKAAYAAMQAAYPVQGIREGAMLGVSQNVLYLLAKLAIAGNTERADIFDALAHEVDHLPPGPAKLVLLDRLVTYYLAHDTLAHLQQLDLWSLAALELSPERATLRGSRGAVLVELGRYDEALEMLANADESDAFNRSINAAFRALALFRKGDLSVAKATFVTAQDIGKTIDLPMEMVSEILDRIGREILNDGMP